MLPKFHVGDIVENTATRIQGRVVEVNAERDLYRVEFPSYSGTYTRPMLRLVLAAEDAA